MSYTMDTDLEAGIQLIEQNTKINTALKLINKSARFGKTPGKSYFEIGEIFRKGIPGLEANPEDARKYYDIAMVKFEEGSKDSLDYREMGDYYYYGLGTKKADKNAALVCYSKAAEDGDEIAAERKAEIQNQLDKGDSSSTPTLTPDTVAKEEKTDEEENAEPLKEATASAPDQNQEEKETPKGDVTEESVKDEPTVQVSPVVIKENMSADTSDKIISEEIDSDQILIKALRILDSVTAAKAEKLDAVELVKTASEGGSVRASVLMGFFYEGDNSLVDTDFEMSRHFYEKAIEQGSSSAKYRLGILYTDKEVPFFDLKKGHDLIIASAHDGYSFALCYLGDCFRSKVDDTRNLEVAYRYYALAGERGLGLGYHYMAEIDASRQQLDLAKKHEKSAAENGFDVNLGYQDPLFYSLHI